MAPGSVTGSRKSLDLDAENHAALCDRRADVMQGVTVSYYEMMTGAIRGWPVNAQSNGRSSTVPHTLTFVQWVPTGQKA